MVRLITPPRNSLPFSVLYSVCWPNVIAFRNHSLLATFYPVRIRRLYFRCLLFNCFPSSTTIRGVALAWLGITKYKRGLIYRPLLLTHVLNLVHSCVHSLRASHQPRNVRGAVICCSYWVCNVHVPIAKPPFGYGFNWNLRIYMFNGGQMWRCHLLSNLFMFISSPSFTLVAEKRRNALIARPKRSD